MERIKVVKNAFWFFAVVSPEIYLWYLAIWVWMYIPLWISAFQPSSTTNENWFFNFDKKILQHDFFNVWEIILFAGVCIIWVWLSSFWFDKINGVLNQWNYLGICIALWIIVFLTCKLSSLFKRHSQDLYQHEIRIKKLWDSWNERFWKDILINDIGQDQEPLYIEKLFDTIEIHLQSDRLDFENTWKLLSFLEQWIAKRSNRSIFYNKNSILNRLYWVLYKYYQHRSSDDVSYYTFSHAFDSCFESVFSNLNLNDAHILLYARKYELEKHTNGWNTDFILRMDLYILSKILNDKNKLSNSYFMETMTAIYSVKTKEIEQKEELAKVIINYIQNEARKNKKNDDLLFYVDNIIEHFIPEVEVITFAKMLNLWIFMQESITVEEFLKFHANFWVISRMYSWVNLNKTEREVQFNKDFEEQEKNAYIFLKALSMKGLYISKPAAEKIKLKLENYLKNNSSDKDIESYISLVSKYLSCL